jgi:hypothetical protein
MNANQMMDKLFYNDLINENENENRTKDKGNERDPKDQAALAKHKVNSQNLESELYDM